MMKHQSYISMIEVLQIYKRSYLQVSEKEDIVKKQSKVITVYGEAVQQSISFPQISSVRNER